MATKQIAWTTGSGYITLTYNGLGNGTITVSSDDNTGVAREQIITIETTAGTPVVTKNITIRQEAYVPPIWNFSYTGTVQSCTLPPGLYRLQCWGAQGGSNPADSTYGISSYDGGKGGYSEGILKLTSSTTVYIFVGGQPSTSSTNGGWNGGGGGSGTSTNGTPETATYGLGISKVGRGGGATDIALTTSTMSYSSYRTNRSSASLLSRFIVAGGGSGGGGALQRITTSSTTWTTLGTIDCSKTTGTTFTLNGYTCSIEQKLNSSGLYYVRIKFNAGVTPFSNDDKLRISFSSADSTTRSRFYSVVSGGSATSLYTLNYGDYELTWNYTVPSGSYLRFQVWQSSAYYTGTVTIEKQESSSTTTDNYSSCTGYAGGGVESEGYSSTNNTYYATQNAAGNHGDFGFGANQIGTSYRYVSPCGGGGWYGGGESYNNNTTNNSISLTGGGSGFVNIAANAQYRPSNYTGLELLQGTTIKGNSIFESPSGTQETGHSGDGYARISNLYAPEALLKVPISFDIISDGTIVWKTTNSSLTKVIQYRKNYGSWTSITSSTSGVSISVVTGDLLQFRGDNTAYGDSSNYSYFAGTADFNVYGNIMSLISSTNYANATSLSTTYTFNHFFYNNTHIVDASRLQMPATTLANYCYYCMFYNASNLTHAPNQLPATTLANQCYRAMFRGCSSLVSVPNLMATTLVNLCYYRMFYDCSSLQSIKCAATSGINTNNSTTEWMYNVAATGTFSKASGATWPTGVSGIPSGWEIISI